MNEPVPYSPPPKKRGWLKKLGLAAAVCLVLLVAAYFTVTSAAFLKAVVLPRAGKALGVTLTLEDASLSPFSQVTLKGLKIQAAGAEPLLQVGELRARYDLREILKGHILVEEVFIGASVANVSQSADGKFNFDPILAATKSSGPKKEKSSKPSATPQLDIKSVKLENATIHFTQQLKGGARQIELSGVNLSVAGVKNGQQAKVTLVAQLKADLPAATNRNQVNATLNAEINPALGADLMPTEIKAGVNLALGAATGDFADLNGLSATLAADWTPAELKRLALNFTKGTTPLGEVRVSGPFDANKLEGKLKVEVAAIDRNVLNLAGAVVGLDFGSTVLNTSNEIELAKNAKLITVNGSLAAKSLAVTRAKQKTPPLDLASSYRITLDLPAESANLAVFSLEAKQKDHQLLSVLLAQPMALAWGKSATNAVGDSALDINVTNLELADWRAFIGRIAPTGNVTIAAKLLAQQAGRKVDFSVGASIGDLTVNAGTNAFTQLGATARVHALVDDFQRVQFVEARVDATQARLPLAWFSAAGTLDAKTRNADVQMSFEAIVPRVLEILRVPEPKAGAGRVSFTGRLGQQITVASARTNSSQTVSGRLALTGFSGVMNKFRLENFSTALDVEAELKDGRLAQVSKLSGSLALGGAPAGGFDVTGAFDLAAKSGTAQLKVVDVNQNLALPFLTPLLTNQTLVSASLNADVNANFTATETSAKGGVHLARFVLRDRAGQFPSTPFALEAQFDATASQPATNATVVQLRQFTAAITAAGQPGGTLDASGGFDSRKQQARFSVKLADVNERLLRPFLAPALGDKSLLSVAINASASGSYDAKADSTVTGDFGVSNLRVHDPSGQLPETPLGVHFGVEAAMKNNVADIKALVLNLTPTLKAKNQLVVSGRVDVSNTNAALAALKVNADALDLTPYYDLFAKPANTNAPAPAKEPGGPSLFSADPKPVRLPLRASSLDVNLGAVYLRDLAVSNVVVAAKVDGGRVRLDTLQLALNGAPVKASADLDLGVPGWRYDVALKSGRIPVQPLADTFSPAYKGQAQGDFLADIALKGAGTTGASLRKNLDGHVTLSFTNANIQLAGANAKRLWTPIAAFLGLDELHKSPLDWLAADIRAGNGGLIIREFTIHSPAFIAESTGTIPFADVLTNSPLSQPVEIHLPQSLAKRFPLLSVLDTEPYTKLPTFVKLKGTLGHPEVQIDRVKATFVGANAVAGVATALPGKAGEVVRGATGVVKEVGKDVTGALKGIGSLFGGKSSTNAPSATQTNKPRPGIFDFLPKKKQ